MKNKLTASQIKGVTITDRDLCVVAGPGSGKTRVLVERFANLVAEHNVSINEILTLTFTEKAANEMKIRAASLFEDKGMEKERQEIEFAYLSTIHSFCSRLLRENAIEASIDPQFRVMDELEAGRLKEQALENTFKERTDEKTLDTFLNGIFWKQTDSKKSRLKSFKENLIMLYEKIRNASVPTSETVNIDDLSQDIVNSYKMTENLINEIVAICSDKSLTPKTREKVEYVLERWNTSSMQKEVDGLYGQTKKNLATSPPYEGGERGVVKSTEIPSDIKQSSERGDLI
ncbi:MAG: UvrD-helicase domain-containing protein, partial [Planctomycetota bacterium]